MGDEVVAARLDLWQRIQALARLEHYPPASEETKEMQRKYVQEGLEELEEVIRKDERRRGITEGSGTHE